MAFSPTIMGATEGPIREKVLSSGGIETLLIENRNGKQIKKILVGASPHDQEQLETEIQALKNLDHPRIPKLIDSQTNGGFELTREFKEGKSFHDILNEGYVFGRDEVIDIALQTLDILNYVHRKGILHRDIKPSNLIWNTEGNEVYLVDLGIAKLRFFGGGTTTSTGGSFPYMAPEQYLGKVSRASDIFSLGATLVELLTGKTLDNYVQGESILEQRVELPETIDYNLRNVLMLMTETDSRRRYQSCEDVKATFEAIKEGSHLQLAVSGKPALPALMDREVNSPAKEVLSLLEKRDSGFTVTAAITKALHDLIQKCGYVEAKSHNNFMFYYKETECNSLPVAIVGKDSIYHTVLKEEKFFNKFYKHHEQYLSFCEPGFLWPDEQKKLYKSLPQLPEVYSKIDKWVSRFNDVRMDRNVGIGVSFSIIGLPLSLPMIIFSQLELNRLRANPPSFSEEKIEEWKPYLRSILKDADAVKQICGKLTY